jgi:LysM repeat protein
MDFGASRRAAALLLQLSIVLAAVLVGAGTVYLLTGFAGFPGSGTSVGSPAAVPPPAITVSPLPSATVMPSARGIATSPPTLSPTPAVTASSQPQATPAVHIVSRGENISMIASRYGVTVEEIVELNQLDDPSLIRVDQRLLLPPAD